MYWLDQSPVKRVVLFFVLVICLTSCWNSGGKVPFPENESEFTEPQTKAFSFSEPEKIQWKTVPRDSMQVPVTKKFSLDKLPAKPFNLGGAKPLAKLPTEKRFDWNSLPDTTFNMSDLPADTLKIKTIKLLPPKVVVSGWPVQASGMGRGFMDATPIGLPGTARDFLKDASGALWIATSKGLCRYDGTYLEIYGLEQGFPSVDLTALLRDRNNRIWVTSSRGDVFILDERKGILEELEDRSPSVADGVFNLLEDTEGRIWIPTYGNGVSVFDPTNNTVRNIPALAGKACVEMMQDSDGLIWLTTFQGMFILDLKANRLKKIQPEHGLLNNAAIGVLQTKAGKIWIASVNGLTIIDRKEGTVKYLGTAQGILTREAENSLAGLMEDSSGKIWVGSNKGMVYAFDLKHNLLEKFPVNPGQQIFNMVEDNKGQVWVGSANGLTAVFNQELGRPGNFTEAEGLGSVSVWSTLEADDGKIWMGTNSGINVFDPATESIQYITKKDGLAFGRASYLLEDSKGRMWIGSNGNGTEILDLKNGTHQLIQNDPGVRFQGATICYEDSNGDMWVGTGTGELYTYNPDTRTKKRILNVPASWKDSYINSMQPDSKGQLWITSGAGAIVINANRSTMKFFDERHGLVNNNATALLEASDKRMWLSTGAGVHIINEANDSLTTLTMAEGLADNGAFTLSERHGTMYVGTTNGLSLVKPTIDKDNRTSYEITNLRKAQGLGAVDFLENSSMFTKRGQYWAGIEEVVLLVMDSVRIDPTPGVPYIAAINLNEKRHDFRDRASLAPDNYLITNNITWDSLETTFYIPQNLVLPYTENYLSFNYSGMQLNNPDKVRYRYMLEGIDKNWSAITDKVITENYRDLPPGKYTFKVVSRGINGVWSKPASVSFIITPPWWKTWWAYVVYAIAFLGVMSTVISVRSRALKRQNQILEEKVVNRTNALQKSLNDLQETQKQLIQSEKMASLGELTAGIAHEIQNPLNFVNNFSDVNKELIVEMKQELTAGNLENAKDLANDIAENEDKIIYHGKRADAIVKSMLQHSRSSNSKKEPTDINALADEYLRLAYHGLRAKDKSFNATMKTDFDSNLGKVEVIPQDLGRVILNLITNAFYAVTEKKAQETKNASTVKYEPTVTVSTRKVGHTVEIRVSDNGNGIPQHIVDKIFQPFFTTKPAGQGTGLGLSMSYDIVTKAHGGELKVETNEGQGTTFSILITA